MHSRFRVKPDNLQRVTDALEAEGYRVIPEGAWPSGDNPDTRSESDLSRIFRDESDSDQIVIGVQPPITGRGFNRILCCYGIVKPGFRPE